MGGGAIYTAPNENNLEVIRHNFEPLEITDDFYAELFTPEKYTRFRELPLGNPEEYEDPTVLYRGGFSVYQDDTFVDISVESDSQDDVSLSPLIVTLNEDREQEAQHFLIPYIKSIRQTRILSQLGSFDSGEETTITIRELPTSAPIDREKVHIYLENPQGTHLQEMLRRTSPMYGIRKNNINADHPEYLMNDIPLIGFTNVLKKGDIIETTDHIILSGEDGGTYPDSLLSQYNRSTDDEWAILEHRTVDGSLLTPAYYQAARHQPEKFYGIRLSNHPQLQIATDNNNFSTRDYTNYFYFPKRQYFSIPYTKEEIVKIDRHIHELNPEFQIISYREAALGSLNSQRNQRWFLDDGDEKANELLTVLRGMPAAIFPHFPLEA